jgi:hypothetical protein
LSRKEGMKEGRKEGKKEGRMSKDSRMAKKKKARADE